MPELIYDGFVKVTKIEHENKSYDKVDFKNAVSAFVSTEDGHHLFVKQFRPAVNAQTIEIPAGVMDDDSLTIEETIKKELFEEAGILESDIISMRLLVQYYMAIGVSDNVMSIFHVKVKNDAKDRPFKDNDVASKFWADNNLLSEMWQTGMLCDAKTNIAVTNTIISMNSGSL